MPGMIRFLPLREGGLDRADQADVFIDHDAEGQNILSCLAFVEFADAELEVTEAVQRPGERRGEFDEGEGVEGGAEVAAGFGEGFTLGDDGVGGFEEGFELILECVEVDLAVVEPLRYVSKIVFCSGERTSYIVVLYELSATSTTNSDYAEHTTLALAKIWSLSLLVLDVDIERFALEEKLEVAIMLKDWMCGSLIQHTLQSSTSRFDEVGVEATHGLLLWRWRDNNTGVVAMQLVVQPEEVSVTAGDVELGVAVRFRSSLRYASAGSSRDQECCLPTFVLTLYTVCELVRSPTLWGSPTVISNVGLAACSMLTLG